VSLRIRAAGPGDAAAIRAVHLAAFPTALEADLVDALERADDVTRSLVAEESGRILGHVLLSRMMIEDAPTPLRAVGLAPVAVQPDRQAEGIGSRLVSAGVEAAREAEEDIIFLVGDPDYYGRFGFTAAAAAPFVSPYAGPYVQALWVRDRLEKPARAKAHYADAFAAFESG
jgi:putative acetyltransferase